MKNDDSTTHLLNSTKNPASPTFNQLNSLPPLICCYYSFVFGVCNWPTVVSIFSINLIIFWSAWINIKLWMVMTNDEWLSLPSELVSWGLALVEGVWGGLRYRGSVVVELLWVLGGNITCTLRLGWMSWQTTRCCSFPLNGRCADFQIGRDMVFLETTPSQTIYKPWTHSM